MPTFLDKDNKKQKNNKNIQSTGSIASAPLKKKTSNQNKNFAT